MTQRLVHIQQTNGGKSKFDFVVHTQTYDSKCKFDRVVHTCVAVLSIVLKTFIFIIEDVGTF